MKDKTSNAPIHACIYHKSKDNKNSIGAVLSGIKNSNVEYSLEQNNYKAIFYRYSPKKVGYITINRIRNLIGQQSYVWYLKSKEKSFFPSYNYENFYYYLFSKHGHKMKFKNYEEKKRKFTDFIYKITNNKYAILLNTLLYINYALRKHTFGSKRGFVCSEFVLACIGSALLDDVLNIYSLKTDNNIYPSLNLKYHKKMYGASDAYNTCIELLNSEKGIKYNKKKFIEALSLEYSLSPEECIEKGSWYKKKPPIDKIEIPLAQYLYTKKTSVEYISKIAMKRLETLQFINPELATLEDMERYLNANTNIWAKGVVELYK